jgi:hypothetical protein
MEQLPNYGDDRQLAACIYCGGETESREHVPSRVILDEPYPENLPTVPACVSCNTGFSEDEEYFACLVECARMGSIEGIEREKITRILQRKPSLSARINAGRTALLDGKISFSFEVDRVRAVVRKLAEGHCAFELNERWNKQPVSMGIAPLLSLPVDSLRRFESPFCVSILPEVGSRAMQRLAVVSEIGRGVVDWITVQANRYRYLAAVEAGGMATVRIVVSEYLAAEVRWD